MSERPRLGSKRKRSSSSGGDEALNDDVLSSLGLPPLALATAANQLQHLQLAKHIERFLGEKLLREFPRFNVGSSQVGDEGQETVGRKLQECSSTPEIVGEDAEGASHLLGFVPVEEDFCSSDIGARLLGEDTRKSEDRDEAPTQSPQEELLFDLNSFEDEDWQRFYRAHSQFVLGERACRHSNPEGLSEGTQLNLYKYKSAGPSGQSGDKDKKKHQERRINLLYRHYKREWVPFAENHRHDSYVSNPLSFLTDLVERFGAWATALREGSVANSLASSSSVSSSGKEEGPGDVVPFPAFGDLHVPAVLVSQEGTSAFDSSKLGKGPSATQTHPEPNRFTFAALACSDLGVVGFAPTSAASVGSSTKRKRGAASVGEGAVHQAERELAVANEHHAALTRMLWAATGGTKRATNRKHISKASSKKKKLGKRRKGDDSDFDFSDDESVSSSEESGEEDGDASSLLGALAMGPCVLTVARGVEYGVDDRGEFEGEVCLGGGVVKIGRK